MCPCAHLCSHRGHRADGKPHPPYLPESQWEIDDLQKNLAHGFCYEGIDLVHYSFDKFTVDGIHQPVITEQCP